MQIIRPLAILLLGASLSACLKAHRIDIQQGNLITDQEVQQLQPGMTKRQVRYILGTPLIVDPFHQNRWDYFYSLEQDRKQVAKRTITVVFEEDTMVRVEGDVTYESAEVEEGEGPVIIATPEDDRGFFAKTWDKIKVWDKDKE